MNKNSKMKLPKLNARAVKNGSYAIVISLAAIAIAVIVNLIVGLIPSKYSQIDVSEKKLYTVGEETKSALANLSKDITIYFITQDSNTDSTVDMLLQSYADLSSHISVVKKDPVLYPGFTSAYTSDSVSENSLIVTCGDKSKVLDNNVLYTTTMNETTYQQDTTAFDGEGQITAAIQAVTSDTNPKAYLINGHNESGLDATLKQSIEKMNIEISDLTLLTSGIPDDANMLIITSPQADYSAEDAQAVIDYLDQGGKALIFTNYTNSAMPNFNKILGEFNMRMAEGVVLEGDQQHYRQYPTYLVPIISTSSNLTKSVRDSIGYVFMPIAQGLKVADENNKDITIESLLTTSESSFAKKDAQNMQNFDKADGDEDGPFIVGAVAYKMLNSGKYSNEMQISIFTSASFATSSANNMVSGANFELVTNTVSWLLPEETKSSIPSKNVSVNYLTIPSSSATLWSNLLMILLPLLFLAAGSAVWFVRRKR